jgi:hypothetical protein
LFHHWIIFKAGDVSAIGAFETSIIKTLYEVIDENNEGIFPSPSAVDRACKLVDNNGSTAGSPKVGLGNSYDQLPARSKPFVKNRNPWT